MSSIASRPEPPGKAYWRSLEEWADTPEFRESVAREFAPFRERAAHYRERPEEVLEILAQGARRATSLAQSTMAEVRRRMGMDWRKSLS